MTIQLSNELTINTIKRERNIKIYKSTLLRPVMLKNCKAMTETRVDKPSSIAKSPHLPAKVEVVEFKIPKSRKSAPTNTLKS